MKSRIGCWTCKARRVQCDGHQPTCRRCALAKRVCEGYQMRLSWPRDGDGKRAIMATSLPAAMNHSHSTGHFFINTTWRDVELYRYLLPQVQPPHPLPGLWRQPEQEVNHTDLVHFFYRSAYMSLVTFSATNFQVRDVLVRLALPHDAAPGLGLFYALLAFSSLCRDGVNQQAAQLKIAALECLAAAARAGVLSTREAAQHVAASMLLGAFEIMIPSESSGEWMWYVWGAMDIVTAHSLQDRSCEGDIGILLDWVYYHNALSRFTQHHSRHKSLALEATATDDSGLGGTLYKSMARHKPLAPSPTPSHAVLNLLTEICDTVVDPLDFDNRNEEHQGRLKALEGRLGNLSVTAATADCGADTTLLPVNLYDISARIYLARASQSPWEPPTQLDSLIEMAFSVATSAFTCKHFFPLFVVACEARTDERRAAIFRLIESNEASGMIRSMEGLKAVIESIWVQQDLHADSELLPSYLGTMSAVISSSDILPSFV